MAKFNNVEIHFKHSNRTYNTMTAFLVMWCFWVVHECSFHVQAKMDISYCGLKQQCCALSMGHRLVESTREAKTAVGSSLVPHAVLLMPSRAMKCTLVV